jgi:RNA polymerase sigma factor (sigma-70 family)
LTPTHPTRENDGIETPSPAHEDSNAIGRDGTPAAGAAFSPTQWSVVLAARSDSTLRREALDQLCATYWPPIYGYLRRRGHAPSDAEDLTQGFFLYLMESDFLDRPDPQQGRFRGYLIGALKHFLGSHFERAGALKRGGRATFINWSEVDPEKEFAALGQSQQDPAELFETSWALTLLGGALRKLEEEQIGAGRAHQFAVLKPYLSAAPSRGDYDHAAAVLGTSRANVAVWVHRLNQRYGELVRLAVAATVQNPTEVNEELRHLLKVLRR